MVRKLLNKHKMELKLTVIANQSATQTRQVRNEDNTVKQETTKVSRITARSTDAQLTFTTDYDNGKTFDLDRELLIQIE